MKNSSKDYSRSSRARLTDGQKAYLNQYYTRSWKAWIGRKVHASIAEDKLKCRDVSLTSDDIMKMLETSDYTCSLSGVRLTHDKSLCSLSIDRIDNDLGHTKTNVQLVCMGLNLAKNKATNDDAIELLENLIMPTFLPKKFSRDYISSCRRNASARKDSSITTDDIIKLYDLQQGKCFYSGINLAAYKHPVFSLSIDRINNGIGYHIDNIRLSVLSLNRAKGIRADTEFLPWLESIRESYERKRRGYRGEK